MDREYVEGGQIILNKWNYAVTTIADRGKTAILKFFINGKFDKINSVAFTGIDSGGDLYIGDWVGTGPGTQDWAGKLDEIRISSVIRNSSWINTEYNNQQNPDTFIKLGNQVDRTNQISMRKTVFLRMLKSAGIYDKFLIEC
jgi:hypothetical protein